MLYTITKAIVYFNTITWVVVLLFTLFQFHLLIIYLLKRKKVQNESIELIEKEKSFLPFVTIQIPVYNERYVVERVISAVASFSYPIDKIEIQVLDDSTDDTSSIITKEVNFWKNMGIDIIHIQRHSREGFKAGALRHGLEIAKGELIAIFDADFMPSPDFLEQTVPFFTNPKLGFIQTKWQHLNREYSLITKLQAFGLDAHYTIQQVGRNAQGYFSNFTGTAGVWRKSCIIDSGNWQSDTLTEDLDLSYCAQLKGWEFRYLEHVEAVAELPPTIGALKSQQYRWTKGAVESARKHLKGVLLSKKSITTKLHALFHILYVGVFLFAFISSLLSIPLLFISIKTNYVFPVIIGSGWIYISCCIINTLFFWTSFSHNYISQQERVF